MSEGAWYEVSEAPVWLESLGRLFAKRTPRPKAAGPDAGRLKEGAIAGTVQTSQILECTVPAGGVLAMRPLLLHSSGKVAAESPRRVIHIEYADSSNLGVGLELAVA